MLLPAQSFWFGSIWVEFFEELHQPVNQPASAPDYMQTALVLMFFQYLVQTTFQLIHTSPPQLGSNCVADFTAIRTSEARNNSWLE
jgi:hypothetical protein